MSAASKANSRHAAKNGRACAADLLATGQLQTFGARLGDVIAILEKMKSSRDPSTQTFLYPESRGGKQLVHVRTKQTGGGQASESLIGRTVLHYRILAKIGRGAMGVLYRAEDTRLGRQVAVKFASEMTGQNTLIRECFHREACAASSCNHPNICAVYDVGEFAGRPFIVMELLEGETLQRLSQNPLDIETCLNLGIQISDALDRVHNSGIIHRDIKPSNIFVTTSGQSKLLDFGLAMSVQGPEGKLPERVGKPLTKAAADVFCALGTPAYMSPEQALCEPLDPRSDLFSMGVVLYEILTGERPFQGSNTESVLKAVINGPFVPVSKARAGLPERLGHLVEKTLEKDREYRCQSAAELRADLRRLHRDLRAESSWRARSAGNFLA